MRRQRNGETSIDFMRVDWFDLAPLPIGEVRDRFGLVPRSATAVAAGSRTPFEPGGISPFQMEHGRAIAELEGRSHETWGAEPA